MKRILVFGYAIVVYIIFLATLIYAMGFIGNLLVPKSIDSAMEKGSLVEAFLIDVALLGIFAIQHSGMARQRVKDAITRFIPTPIERSTYVLFSCLALLLLFWQWRPIGGLIWQADHVLGQTLLDSVYAFGWVLVLSATFLVDHFDLSGLRQVYMYWHGQPYRSPAFVTPGLYRHIRHPLYLGWLLVCWATPIMTVGHLVFALVSTVYILFAIQLEEKDLISRYGRAYANYRRRVPMLLPIGKKRSFIAREALS